MSGPRQGRGSDGPARQPRRPVGPPGNPPGGAGRGDEGAAARISAALLRWFDRWGRTMAWRTTMDPYRIWVSEIMLQQTRVGTVAPYFRTFLDRFPDVRALAAAPLDEVLAAWEGMGYYARARNLHRAAGIVVDRFGGVLPCEAEALRALPGVGRSTAGAIAAIAFGRDEPILDANARRVVARLFAVRGHLRGAAAEGELWRLSASLVAGGKGRETALAVMDLGAAVCVPSNPRCGDCPLGGECAAFRCGLQESIPARAERRRIPHHDVVAAVFLREDGAVYVRRRPDRGLLGGLWALPSGKRADGEALEDALRRSVREKLALPVAIQRKVGTVRHAYSHFRITLHGYVCSLEGGGPPPIDGAGWVGPAGAAYALPRADRKLLEQIRGEERR